ncbi:hypothetical protein DFH29DRAFT_875804 [Suillus ampliporus]|nr:hypothetical protein DFH29DRAFT_875804 [Suillus ampliporus]
MPGIHHKSRALLLLIYTSLGDALHSIKSVIGGDPPNNGVFLFMQSKNRPAQLKAWASAGSFHMRLTEGFPFSQKIEQGDSDLSRQLQLLNSSDATLSVGDVRGSSLPLTIIEGHCRRLQSRSYPPEARVRAAQKANGLLHNWYQLGFPPKHPRLIIQSPRSCRSNGDPINGVMDFQGGKSKVRDRVREQHYSTVPLVEHRMILLTDSDHEDNPVYTRARTSYHELTVLLRVLATNDKTRDWSSGDVQNASGAVGRNFHRDASLLASGRNASSRVIGTESAPATVAFDLQMPLDVGCIAAWDISPIRQANVQSPRSQVNIADSEERAMQYTRQWNERSVFAQGAKADDDFEFGASVHKENRLPSLPKREVLPKLNYLICGNGYPGIKFKEKA